MKLRSVFLAVAALAFTTPICTDALSQQAPAAPASQVADVLTKVQAFYDATTSYKADFNQEYLVKQYNVKKNSHGHVTFAKPGKMDWVYDDPAGNRVVSDGHLLKVYEAQNKQMYETQLDQSQYPAALSFLTGQGKLGDTFDFQLYDGKTMSFPGGSVLVGTPKTPTPAYQKIFLYVDGKTSQVRRVLVLDGQGNRNRFDFLAPRINDPVPANEFVFTPPQGTSIVRP